MEQFITQIAPAVVSAVVSAVVASVIASGKRAGARQRALDDGMKALLKAELYAIWHDYVVAEQPMPMYVRDIASSCYRVYHDGLSGNGTGTSMYEAISQAAIKGDDR